MLRHPPRSTLSPTLSSYSTLFRSWAVLMYYIEREAQPDAFTDIFQGFWCAIITFTSIGSGDIYPITLFGKIIACCLAFVVLITLALPT